MKYERISYIIILVKLTDYRGEETGKRCIVIHQQYKVYIGSCIDKMSKLTKGYVKEIHILEFKVGNNSYGIDIDKVLEIKKREKATYIHGAHPWIDGVFIFRNQVVTSINMFKSCKIEENQEANSNMNIIVQVGDDSIGLLVSSVLDTHIVSMEDIKPLEEKSVEEIGMGILSKREKKITIIDITKLISVLRQEKTA